MFEPVSSFMILEERIDKLVDKLELDLDPSQTLDNRLGITSKLTMPDAMKYLGRFLVDNFPSIDIYLLAELSVYLVGNLMKKLDQEDVFFHYKGYWEEERVKKVRRCREISALEKKAIALSSPYVGSEKSLIFDETWKAFFDREEIPYVESSDKVDLFVRGDDRFNIFMCPMSFCYDSTDMYHLYLSLLDVDPEKLNLNQKILLRSKLEGAEEFEKKDYDRNMIIKRGFLYFVSIKTKYSVSDLPECLYQPSLLRKGRVVKLKGLDVYDHLLTKVFRQELGLKYRKRRSKMITFL